MSYIENAIRNGGVLTVKRIPGGLIQAEMVWQDRIFFPPLAAAYPTIEKALFILDAAIMEDMGDEMVQKGAV